MGAEEAERCGLVARVVPADRLIEEALKTAQAIAAHVSAGRSHGQGGGRARL